MKKIIKKTAFILIIAFLIFIICVVIKKGKFEKLEGYMYSFAAEIINTATDSNAIYSDTTSCNTLESATSSNATSSNVPESATSSNATSSNVPESATSSNATSSDVPESATSSNATSSDVTESATASNAAFQNNMNVEEVENIIDVNKKETINKTQLKQEKKQVSFLESHKMYIIIIGVSILAIVIVTIIVIIDKKAIEKRKTKNDENK